MRIVRTTWFQRIVVAVFLFSLYPLFVTLPQERGTEVDAEEHAEWLRKQVRGQVPDALERAIGEASAEDHKSRVEFLRALVDAYEAENPEDPLSSYFSGAFFSNEVLLALLQGRLHLVRYDSMAGVNWIRSGLFTVTPLIDRAAAEAAELVVPLSEKTGGVWGYAHTKLEPVLIAFRSLSAARPMGP